MKSKIIISAVIGGIASFLCGFICYNVLLSNYFKENVKYGAIVKAPYELWAIFTANILMGFFFVIIFEKWASISTFKSGFKAGAWMGLLIGATFNLLNYSVINAENLQSHGVKTLIWGVVSAVGCGVAGWVLGYGNNKAL